MDEFYRILKKSGILVFSLHHPFMDFTVFNRENYFLKELLTDEWQTHKGKEEVPCVTAPNPATQVMS